MAAIDDIKRPLLGTSPQIQALKKMIERGCPL